MILQMMQVYRNTCDRSVYKKHEKSPKGNTRPPNALILILKSLE